MDVLQRRLARAVGSGDAWVLAMFMLGIPPLASAQVAGPSINMVSGTNLPGGDPFLQRQNEPSIAVSTRNPCHLFAGSNDYRTVDMPGLPADKESGDAWLGVYKSLDCGRTWASTLLAGYPQDTTPEGAASPLRGMAAGADPVVRAGTHGLFYYGGIVFNRGTNALSRVFVARFIDTNVQTADPIAHLGTSIVDAGTAGQFTDKPSLAVDIPRPGARTCSVGGQSLPAGNVYVAYSSFVGQQSNNTTKLMLSRSTDCGATWEKAVKLTEGVKTNQGATLAVAPSGAVYVAWRQFASTGQGDAILVARSTDFGRTFGKAVQVAALSPFDQGTSTTSFRTNAYPTMAIDGTDRVYVAWSARGFATPRSDPGTGDARIVVSSSAGGRAWSMPSAVDNRPGTLGHQFMPALAFAGGRLQVIYYDLQEDSTLLEYRYGLTAEGLGAYSASYIEVGDRPTHPEKVFWDFVSDTTPPALASLGALLRRHTLDVRGAQARPGAVPAFTAWPISQYSFGMTDLDIEQLQFNPPNLPLYARGTAPFLGDYIDVAALSFVPTPEGGWAFNAGTAPGTPPPVFHAVWTDNRDVRPPVAPQTWESYTPPTFSQADWPANPLRPACVPGTTGMRNANVYTSRITPGLSLSTPGNALA